MLHRHHPNWAGEVGVYIFAFPGKITMILTLFLASHGKQGIKQIQHPRANTKQ